MEKEEKKEKKGLSKNVILFFVFAVVIVAAFLIVGLVNTCTTEHENAGIEQQESFLGE